MKLNTIKPAQGSKKLPKRVGRGIGSGLGKTCGRGHKGQKSRSGGFHKVGFEGGQMPIQRRLPKVGFSSRKKPYTAQIRLHELALVSDDTVTLEALKEADIIPDHIRSAKIIDSGKLEVAKTIKGLAVTPGARKVIESAGGKIEA